MSEILPFPQREHTLKLTDVQVLSSQGNGRVVLTGIHENPDAGPSHCDFFLGQGTDYQVSIRPFEYTKHPVGEYLGDGVYAEYQTDGVWLRTERENGVHEIFLDDEVFTSLVKGVAKHYANKTNEVPKDE